MTLAEVNVGEEYIIKDIDADGDEELIAFLFSLGCYSGEPITVVSRKKSGCVVSIKDGRYNIDNDLAGTILVLQSGYCMDRDKTSDKKVMKITIFYT